MFEMLKQSSCDVRIELLDICIGQMTNSKPKKVTTG